MRAVRPLFVAAALTLVAGAPGGRAGPGRRLSLHGLRTHRRAARRRAPGPAGRGGDEVPLRRGRLHHGAALLQAAEQHGHARGPPLDELRPAARRDPVHGRDRVGLAGGGAAGAGADHAGTPPTSPRTTRARVSSASAPATSSRASTARRCTRRPTPCAGGNGVYRYGRQRVPGLRPSTPPTTGSTPCSTALPPADTRAPLVSSTSPAAGATGVAPGATVTATFDEPLDPLTVNAGVVHARRRHGRRRRGAGHLRRRHAHGRRSTPQAPLALGKTYTATRQERHRRRDRHLRATGWPPTGRGRSARRRSVRAPSSPRTTPRPATP